MHVGHGQPCPQLLLPALPRLLLSSLQDTVPRGGKFVSAYKRNGQRVVVNKAGDMVVRPVPLESSLLQMPLGSNPLHHLLASYQVWEGSFGLCDSM